MSKKKKSRLVQFTCLKCGEDWLFSTTDMKSNTFECPDCGNINPIAELKINKKTWVSMTNQLVEMSKENEQLREENNNMHDELHSYIYYYLEHQDTTQNDDLTLSDLCDFCSKEELK